MKWLIPGVALLAACPTGQAAPSSLSTSIGGRELKLSAPAGYVEFCSQDREAVEVIALEVPPVNEFLGCYTTPGDFEAWTARAGEVFESYVVVSVMKSTIGRTVSAKQGVTIRVEPGRIVPLGVFDEAENYIASAWLASKQIFVDDEPTTSSKVSISTAVLVRGKVLVLATTGECRQVSDIKRYQDIARAWRAQIIADNT